jgi:ATP-dependent exoDNAse (exonuclease V) beta subunit
MLSYRDQWLPLLYQYDDAKRRECLEKGNEQLMLAMAKSSFEVLATYEHTLFEIIEKVSDTVIPPNFTFANINSIDETLLTIIQQINTVFMTKELTLRKRLSKQQGFIAPSTLKDPEEKAEAQALKDDALSIISELSTTDFEESASLICMLCDPAYTEAEWDILSSTFSVLPYLSAELLLTFKQTKESDFIEMQSAALRALGTEDAPSKTLLRLDNKYRHILVDEFQDCGPFQLELLKLLTTGWQKDDGRTLYLVGDPMQSIYLFRNANVGLFISAAEKGIGNIQLDVNRLSSNYRSQSNLIDWVNQKFSVAFGNKVDANIGCTVYNASEGCKAALDVDPVNISVYAGLDWQSLEARNIANQIHQIQSMEPDASIAVLGRTRSDLEKTIQCLKETEVSHRAVNIHKLNALSVITDLTVLTRSMCHLADKQAWVALLRSPLIGLSLSELERVCTDNGKHRARHKDVLLLRLINSDTLASLNESTRNRLERALDIINKSREHFYRKPLESIIKGAFYALGGLSLLQNKSELKAIDTFFDALRKMSLETFTVDKLEAVLHNLYAPVEKMTGSVSVMTKHKAKGLEFDYVFIPQAHKSIQPDKSKLLWFETMLSGDNALTIMSPSMIVNSSNARIDHYIKAMRKQKSSQESIRLAYVATTRAKKQLFISGEARESYPSTSMLGILRVGEAEVCKINSLQELDRAGAIKPTYAVLNQSRHRLLPEGDMLAAHRGIMHIENTDLPSVNWLKNGERIIGIVVHKCIEMIASIGWDAFYLKPLSRYKELWRVLLLQEGLAQSSLVYAVNEIEGQITKLKSSEYMQWALEQPTLEVEKAIYVKTLGKLKKYVLDVTFTFQGERYLIDTKSGRPLAGESEAVFSNRMLAAHAEKMKQYGTCFGEKNIKTGLYLSSIGKTAMYSANTVNVA